MGDLTGAITQMVIMLIVVCIGYACGKLKYLTAEVTNGLNNVLIDIALPCMIIGSVATLDFQSAVTQIGPAFATAFVQFFMLLIFGILFNILFRVPRGQRSLYIFMCLCTNTGFIGIPVLQAAYGDTCVLVASIFLMIGNLFIGSIGFAILDSPAGKPDAYIAQQLNAASVGQENQGAAHSSANQQGAPKKEPKRIAVTFGKHSFSFAPRTLVNAPLIACLIALFVFFAGITFPPVIQGTLEFVGGTCAPVAMLIAGAILSREPLTKVFSEWRLYFQILIRQIIIPIICYFVMVQMGFDELIIHVFVIMFACPVGINVPVFGGRYGHDVRLGASGTALSTMACFAIMPALITLMALF